MKARWMGVSCVVIAALAIVVYKQRTAVPAELAAGTPSVLLVADLKKAGETTVRRRNSRARWRGRRPRGYGHEYSTQRRQP